jgi:hypothetical protein
VLSLNHLIKRRKIMDMFQNGIEIFCLPEGAKCEADEKERNPLDIEKYPMGYSECSGDCFYYSE